METPAGKRDTENFEQLFSENRKALCNLVNKIIRDSSSAEDIVQELFIKLWYRKERLEIQTTLRGYIFKAAANAAIDYLKNRKRVGPMNGMEESELELHYSPSQTLESKDFEIAYRKALNELPPKCRAIFILSRFYGFKYKEIAAHLNISVKTVETQIGIALERLRKALIENSNPRNLRSA